MTHPLTEEEQTKLEEAEAEDQQVARKEKVKARTPRHILRLGDNIKKVGMVHNIVLCTVNGKPEIVSGRDRLEALGFRGNLGDLIKDPKIYPNIRREYVGDLTEVEYALKRLSANIVQKQSMAKRHIEFSKLKNALLNDGVAEDQIINEMRDRGFKTFSDRYIRKALDYDPKASKKRKVTELSSTTSQKLWSIELDGEEIGLLQGLGKKLNISLDFAFKRVVEEGFKALYNTL